MPKNLLKNRKGFTLIEIMVGVSILAGMSLIIYSTLNSSLKGNARVIKKQDLVHSVRTGFELISNDIAQAFQANAAFKGPNSEAMSGFKGDSESLNFSTFSHHHIIKDVRDTDQVSVGYFLKKNDQGKTDLVRRESTTLTPKLDEGGKAYAIIDNVKSVKFEFYDLEKTEWLSEWDSLDITRNNKIPSAVKVNMIILEYPDDDLDREAIEHEYTTIVPVFLYKSDINF